MYQKQFVLVYPSLVEDEVLLRFLFKKFKKRISVIKERLVFLLRYHWCINLERRVFNVLSLITHYHPRRFVSQGTHNMLIEFVHQNCMDSVCGSELLRLLGQIQKATRPTKTEQDDGMALEEMTPKQVAKQLFLIDLGFLKKIPLDMFLDEKFLKQRANSPLRDFSDWFNKRSSYVSSSILQEAAAC